MTTTERDNEARQEAERRFLIDNSQLSKIDRFLFNKEHIQIQEFKQKLWIEAGEWQRDQMKEQIEKLKEEIDLLKKANDGLRTNVNLYAFRQREFPEVEKERDKLRQRMNASTKAYVELKESIERDYIPRKKAMEEIQKRMWAIEKDINDNNFLEARQAHIELESLKQTIQNYGKDQSSN